MRNGLCTRNKNVIQLKKLLNETSKKITKGTVVSRYGTIEQETMTVLHLVLNLQVWEGTKLQKRMW